MLGSLLSSISGVAESSGQDSILAGPSTSSAGAGEQTQIFNFDGARKESMSIQTVGLLAAGVVLAVVVYKRKK